MDSKEYLRTQATIVNMGLALRNLDLTGFLNQITKAETLAPMIDPTMYKKAQDNLTAIKKLATALLPVQLAFEEVWDAVLKTGMSGYMEKPGANESTPKVPST